MADINPHGPSIASSLPLGFPSTPTPTYLHTDVASFPAQAALFKTAFAYNGSIDFFAANAGIDDREDVFKEWGSAEEPNAPDLTTLDVDLGAVFGGLKLFVWYARKSGREVGRGRVRKMVVTASMMGIYPFETNPQYCAAKHGVSFFCFFLLSLLNLGGRHACEFGAFYPQSVQLVDVVLVDWAHAVYGAKVCQGGDYGERDFACFCAYGVGTGWVD